MKRITLLLSLMIGVTAMAQELPQLSPRAKVEQRIGLTDFVLDYSRPSVRGRVIFGDLLPYGEVWRTGANMRSTFKVNHDIEIGGQKLQAGNYGLLTIPEKDSWAVIFSKNPEGWGESDYDKEEDVLRLEAKVNKKEETTETLWIGFDKLEAESGHFVIAFDDVEVRLPIEVKAEEMAWKNIMAEIEENPENAKAYRNAAGYAVKTNKKLDKAEEWIEKSISLDDSWYSHWVKAQVLHANGKTKEGKKSGEKAIEMGKKEKGDEFGYAKVLEEAMSKWK